MITLIRPVELVLLSELLQQVWLSNNSNILFKLLHWWNDWFVLLLQFESSDFLLTIILMSWWLQALNSIGPRISKNINCCSIMFTCNGKSLHINKKEQSLLSIYVCILIYLRISIYSGVLYEYKWHMNYKWHLYANVHTCKIGISNAWNFKYIYAIVLQNSITKFRWVWWFVWDISCNLFYCMLDIHIHIRIILSSCLLDIRYMHTCM